GTAMPRKPPRTRRTDVKRLRMQYQVHRLAQGAPLDMRKQPARCDFADLDYTARLVRDVQQSAMDDDAAHRMPGLSMDVQHDFQSLRRRNISRVKPFDVV